MDFELRRAREKLEREQKERKEKARVKLERERKAKQEALRQREAIEASQRSRRLDAAEAELKVNQQMQENLLSGRGIMFCRTLEAVPYHGSGDKVKLPPSCFTELSDQGAFDKGPIYFQLSAINQESPSDMNAQNRGSTYSGVLEFTANEGTVEIPPHVWHNLFNEDRPNAPFLEVRYVWLPKGTYAKLQPYGIGFSDIPNHKAVLETTLRQHATLSQDDVITVNFGGVTYKLRVLELRPASSVSVLETDMEVDIVSSSDSAPETNERNLIPISFGKSESGVVEEGKYTYYKFSIEEEIFSEDTKVEVRIEAENDDGDTDLYISKHPRLFPTRHQHEWSSHDVGSKTLILNPGEQCLREGTYSIGIYGFKGTTKYKVSVHLQECNHSQKVGQQAVSSSTSMMEVDSVECRNCKHYIPSRTIALHEAYCRRHNVMCKHDGCGVILRVGEAENHVHCEKCGQAFQKLEMEKHMKVFHEPLHCPCGVSLEKEQMLQHQSLLCPLRLITCQFCGDMVQAGSSAMDARDRLRGLTEHESICGSRTAPCDSCGRSVMLKDMDIHQIAVHQRN